MKTIQHDVTFAFIVFFGLIFLFFSPRYEWVEIPGSAIWSGIERQARREGVLLPDLDDAGRRSLARIYQDRRHWGAVEWPYGWSFRLKYISIALFFFGAISFIRGLGLVSLSWNITLWAVGIPSIVLFAAMMLELLRKSTILQGFWFCLLGAFLIVFGTYMMRLATHPENPG